METQVKPKSGLGMVAGIVFIVFGVLLLIHTLGAGDFIPHWLISWPMILIVVGVISGVKHQFRQPGAYMCIAMGFAFLAGQITPEMYYGQMIFPAVLLALGLYLIFGKKNQCSFSSRSTTHQDHAKESGV